MGKNVFVSVGTTKFDELCEVILKSTQLLKSLGFNKLTMQIGNSDCPLENYSTDMTIETYRFKESIADDIKRADLVICHAGAGTCLEVLDQGKPLLAVINTDLMDNHQLEIAEQLQIDGHLYYCTCDTLEQTLEDTDFSLLKPYGKADSTHFFKYLDNFLGIKNT